MLLEQALLRTHVRERVIILFFAQGRLRHPRPHLQQSVPWRSLGGPSLHCFVLARKRASSAAAAAVPCPALALAAALCSVAGPVDCPSA